jgi:hypothetical protein
MCTGAERKTDVCHKEKNAEAANGKKPEASLPKGRGERDGPGRGGKSKRRKKP